jgi:LmbE family N-acetylglucosaminyl deacetylase
MKLYPFLNHVIAAGAMASFLTVSVAVDAQAPTPYPSAYAEPLPVDRGAAAVWQSLKKLQTRASIMMVVAHPDDEDGGMLTYESRGQGADATLLTLNRGEGGQNVMSSDYWDQLGLVRTQELLAAGNAYGVHQYWTRVADFGFSKSIEEALKTWGHDRVLYDCVRVVRMTRPLVVTSSFVGNVSDGHGHHQVAGLMAQEVYKAAGDPNVFPDQIKAGLRPWSPLKVYARVPFARVTEKGIYDYATGHWSPVRFRNYVTDTWIEGIPSTTVKIPEGDYSPLLARSYLTLAREGLANQKSQNGGIGAPPPQPFSSPYHLYATRVSPTPPEHESDFFEGVDISLAGIAGYAPADQQEMWRNRLNELNATVKEAAAAFDATDPAKTAPALAKGLTQTEKLLTDVSASKLPEDAKYNMEHELDIKWVQFNDALGQALGVSLMATVVNSNDPSRSGPLGSLASNQAGTFQTVIPGQTFGFDVHVADQGSQPITIVKTNIVSHAGSDWTITPKGSIDGVVKSGDAVNLAVSATVPADAVLTKPYYSRPNLEQPYYNILDPKYLNLPTMPYPLSAEVVYNYNGVEAHTSGVVQTIHRFTGPGPVPEPLLVAPAISLTVSPQAGIVPLSNATLQLQVTVHSDIKGPAQGQVRLDLPAGWTSEPKVAQFATGMDGDERIVDFRVTPKSVETKPYTITAVAEYNGQEYKQGFHDAGYVGLRPYPYYRDATYRTTGVDVKVAPGLKVGYIMGTGDDVPESLADVGVHVNLVSQQDIVSADLSSYDAIVLGIRAYAARPELKTSSSRLLEYVKNGGIVVVQYQTPEYDHNYGPYPLTLSSDSEKVVEEDSKVSLLVPNDPLLNWPNKITETDFTGWVEERGHDFMRSWDPHYVALTEMHDVDQDPQKGGLLYARYGRGAYIYMSFAFYREMPEGVPGSFRIMSNLISLRKNPSFQAAATDTK